MSCQEYEVLIGDAVDATLDGASRQQLDAHLAVCAACRQMAEDFRVIRNSSLALERPVPPPQVWARIAAAVEGRPSPRRFFGFGLPVWPQLAAAAVGIVLAAGVGWMAWRDLTPTANPGTVIVAGAADRDPQPMDVELKLAEDQYVSAITGLETIAKTSNTELDPGTADVLQASLTVIDQAIGESRAALEEEPASELAQESLFEALRNKVALLQDAVALINEMRKGNPDGTARIVSGLNQ
jgi:hypothetical protein